MKLDKFMKDNVIVFLSSMLVNLLGVFFQLSAGALLGDAMVFSDMNTIFSLHSILTIPLNIIIYIITKYIAELYTEHRLEEIKGSFSKLSKATFGVGLLICCITILASEKITIYFNISNKYYIILEAFFAGFTIYEALYAGIFQGMQYFAYYNILGIIVQLLKIGGLVFSTFSSDKILFIWLVMIIGLIITLTWAGSKVKKVYEPYEYRPTHFDFRKLLKFSIAVVAVNAITTLQGNLDLLFVKHYFNDIAGSYSIVMIFAKCITYFAGAFVIVMFPFTVTVKSDIKKAVIFLKKTFVITAVLEMIAMIVFIMFGQYGIAILYGDTFQYAEKLIIPAVIMIVPVGLITILTNFLLALEYYRGLVICLGISVVIEIIAVNLIPKNIEEMIYLLALVMWGTLIGLFWNVYKIVKN